MSIVKFVVATYASKPERKEYSHETDHYYMGGGVGSSRRRDAKISRYECFFDTLEDAQEYIRRRAENEADQKRVDQINRCGVELLAALESTISDLFYQIESKRGAEVANKYPSVVEGRAAIAKAKGLA